MFKEPVEILPNVSYTACATLKVGATFYIHKLDKKYLFNLCKDELSACCMYFTPQGPDSHYGTKGYKMVTQESSVGTKTSFFFFSSPGNNNGTSVEDGQIPEIIYYT